MVCTNIVFDIGSNTQYFLTTHELFLNFFAVLKLLCQISDRWFLDSLNLFLSVENYLFNKFNETLTGLGLGFYHENYFFRNRSYNK